MTQPSTTLTRRTFLALSATPLAGCGGGELLALALPGTTGTGILALASITGFGSVIVGGQTFDETTATFWMDGVAATRSDLRLGQTVKVTGTCAADGSACSAAQIDVWRTASGLVSSVGSTSCTVNGSTFVWDAATVWDGTSAATLTAGRHVVIWALQANASATQWQITRIAEVAAVPPAITGVLENRQGSWYVGAVRLRQLDTAAQTPGQLVWVQGSLADLGSLEWTVGQTHVAAITTTDTANMSFVLIEGVVTGDAANGRLLVGAESLDVSGLASAPKQGDRVRLSIQKQADGRLHVDGYSTADPDDASHQAVRLSGKVENWVNLSSFSIQGQSCNASQASGDVQALFSGAWVAVSGTRSGNVLMVQTVAVSSSKSGQR